jgi:hypothetical protein
MPLKIAEFETEFTNTAIEDNPIRILETNGGIASFRYRSDTNITKAASVV